MRIQSWFAGGRELIAFGLTLLAGLGATPGALAARGTGPLNYYATETIRYPLALSGAVAPLPNLGRAGQVAAVATGTTEFLQRARIARDSWAVTGPTRNLTATSIRVGQTVKLGV